MKTQRIIIVLVCLLLVLSLSQGSVAAGLPDVMGHWAEEKIRQLVGLEAITGYPDGTFKPKNSITRAEFSSVMWGALGLDETEGETFIDIEGHWGQGRIEALVAEEIIDVDVYKTEYKPNEPITRQEIAMMTANIFDTDTEKGDIPFKDAKQVREEFYNYVVQAFNNEIITGYPDNTFRPEGTATRAEAAVMAVRSLRIINTLEKDSNDEDSYEELSLIDRMRNDKFIQILNLSKQEIITKLEEPDIDDWWAGNYFYYEDVSALIQSNVDGVTDQTQLMVWFDDFDNAAMTRLNSFLSIERGTSFKDAMNLFGKELEVFSDYEWGELGNYSMTFTIEEYKVEFYSSESAKGPIGSIYVRKDS